VLTSYLVSNAIVLPISGWLVAWLGRKRFFLICIVFFTISSFLCGIAPNLASPGERYRQDGLRHRLQPPSERALQHPKQKKKPRLGAIPAQEGTDCEKHDAYQENRFRPSHGDQPSTDGQNDGVRDQILVNTQVLSSLLAPRLPAMWAGPHSQCWYRVSMNAASETARR